MSAVGTDFGNWREDEPPARVDELLAVFRGNVDHLSRLLLGAVPKIADLEGSPPP